MDQSEVWRSRLPKIIAAAINVPVGTTVPVTPAGGVNNLIVSLPPPNRHHHLIRALHDLGLDAAVLGYNQGFLCSDGRFLGREQAYQLARDNRQLTEPLEGGRKFLLSEDLW